MGLASRETFPSVKTQYLLLYKNHKIPSLFIHTDELYGDFEDLETGEDFHGDGHNDEDDDDNDDDDDGGEEDETEDKSGNCLTLICS